ncbi:MAG TPA: proline dehydrogenase family protein [Planctomycetota bacterium]|nr:proline dehydrogenase family protein [Planctomycetota bacterium]
MLARLFPGPMVRWFARPYVAGDSLGKALDVAAALWRDRGILTTLDVLGEEVKEKAKVDANVRLYVSVIDALSRDPRFADRATRPSVSLKPSAFTAGTREEAIGPITGLAAHARDRDVALTIDMEDRRWTDFTIDLAVGIFEKGNDVGTVLQTRLNRTEKDLARIPPGMRLRLVIGIYPEPGDVATTDKWAMKERMVSFARRLLERKVLVEFGTHDQPTVERFVREVAPLDPDRCEVQMLLGVPRTRLLERVRKGALGPALPVRLYVPFADGWDDATAYLRRRMAESPSMAWLVLRNLLGR